MLVAELFPGVRQVVLIIRAVGRVHVHEHVGAPTVKEVQFGARLGGVGLEPIAVEVVILRGGAPAHLGGAVLVGAVVGAEAFVAIDAVDRHEKQDGVVEQAVGFVLPTDEQIADERETRVLALAFARVDAGVDEQDFLARGAGLFGGERLVERDDQRHDVAAFRAASDGFDVDKRRCRGKSAAEVHGLGITVGLAVIGGLGFRAPFGRERSVL